MVATEVPGIPRAEAHIGPQLPEWIHGKSEGEVIAQFIGANQMVRRNEWPLAAKAIQQVHDMQAELPEVRFDLTRNPDEDEQQVGDLMTHIHQTPTGATWNDDPETRQFLLRGLRMERSYIGEFFRMSPTGDPAEIREGFELRWDQIRPHISYAEIQQMQMILTFVREAQQGRQLEEAHLPKFVSQKPFELPSQTDETGESYKKSEQETSEQRQEIVDWHDIESAGVDVVLEAIHVIDPEGWMKVHTLLEDLPHEQLKSGVVKFLQEHGVQVDNVPEELVRDLQKKQTEQKSDDPLERYRRNFGALTITLDQDEALDTDPDTLRDGFHQRLLRSGKESGFSEHHLELQNQLSQVRQEITRARERMPRFRSWLDRLQRGNPFGPKTTARGDAAESSLLNYDKSQHELLTIQTQIMDFIRSRRGIHDELMIDALAHRYHTYFQIETLLQDSYSDRDISEKIGYLENPLASNQLLVTLAFDAGIIETDRQRIESALRVRIHDQDQLYTDYKSFESGGKIQLAPNGPEVEVQSLDHITDDLIQQSRLMEDVQNLSYDRDTYRRPLYLLEIEEARLAQERDIMSIFHRELHRGFTPRPEEVARLDTLQTQLAELRRKNIDDPHHNEDSLRKQREEVRHRLQAGGEINPNDIYLEDNLSDQLRPYDILRDQIDGITNPRRRIEASLRDPHPPDSLHGEDRRHYEQTFARMRTMATRALEVYDRLQRQRVSTTDITDLSSFSEWQIPTQYMTFVRVYRQLLA